MKLFYAQTSPFARKVLVLAHELGLADRLETVEVNPWTDEALRRANPFCQVPALVLEDGAGLYDSRVICDHLDGLAGRRALPASGPERTRALRLEALGDGICAATVRRVRERLRPEGDRHHDVAERQALATRAALDVLEAEGPGGGFGLGQIAVACTLGYLDLRVPEDGWRQGRPQLAAWYEGVRLRPSMAATEPPQAPPG